MLYLAATLPLAAPLGAQTDPGARLRGIAVSSFNGQPLRGVSIAVPAARRFVVTDSSGAFRLTGLPAGDQKIQVSYEGRDTEEYEFTPRSGRIVPFSTVWNPNSDGWACGSVFIWTR
jgi:hypothetical protein